MNLSERDKLTIELLSGQASPQQVEKAIDAVAESDESLDEFLDVAEALKAYYDSQAEQQSAVVAPSSHRSRRWVYYAAAAVVLGIVCAVFVFMPRGGDQQQVIVAENETEKVSDGVSSPESEDASQSVMLASNQSESELLAVYSKQDVHASSSAPSSASVAMTYPIDDVQTADGDEQPLVLRWQGSKATATVSIYDVRGVLIDSYTTRSSHINLDYDFYAPYGTIRWVVEFSTADGEELQYSGTFNIIEQY